MKTLKIKKYYSGEIKTDNMKDFLNKETHLKIENFNNETLLYLLALDEFLVSRHNLGIKSSVIAHCGYIPYLRDDKDITQISNFISRMQLINFITPLPPHRQISNVTYDSIIFDNILKKHYEQGYTLIGGDKSASKYTNLPHIKTDKIRKNGKVKSVKIKDFVPNPTNKYLIFDDILGGGATVQMIINQLPTNSEIVILVGYSENLYNPIENNIKIVALATKGEKINEN